MATLISALDPDHIIVNTTDAGNHDAGNIKDVLANYPALASAIRLAVVQDLDSGEDMQIARKIARLLKLGVFISLPAVARTRLLNRIDALRIRKENSLRSVAQINPIRAASKLAELVAMGISITQATLDIVAAAQPTPLPEQAEPDDGL